MLSDTQKPNVFVVGAPKCGTSSIYSYLSKHPEFFVPEIKEVHYFSYPEVGDTYYNATFVTRLTDYEKLYARDSSEAWAGDFSPSYLFNPHAAERIAGYRPDAKIIMVLRDPVDRAISHYLMDCRLGLQQEPLEAILAQPEGYRLFYKEYVELGLYAPQVERYLAKFPDNQISIRKYDSLNNDPGGFVEKLCDFIGIRSDIDLQTTEQHNRFQMPRLAVLGRLKSNRLVGSTVAALPRPVKRLVKQMAYSSQKPDMESASERLKPLFADDIQALEGLTGLDLSNWK